MCCGEIVMGEVCFEVIGVCVYFVFGLVVEYGVCEFDVCVVVVVLMVM